MEEFFSYKNVLVTGATGLIGRALVRRLISSGAAVTAAVRNRDKAESVFSDLAEKPRYIVCDIRELPARDLGVDCVIHAAAETSGRRFVAEPAEIIDEAIGGAKAVLEFSRVNPVKSVVLLSSMEIYGAPLTEEPIREDSAAALDTMSARSAYPESKRLAECMFASYASEYGLPTKVVRLTQTFGPGVAYDDGRVFAEFGRCAIEGRDIVLRTKGETKRNYLHVDDAVEAILTVAARGKVGEAYNAANEATYCSIYEMATLVAKEQGGGKIKVVIEEGDAAALGYAPTLKMNLCAEKLRALGWRPTRDLTACFADMTEDMRRRGRK